MNREIERAQRGGDEKGGMNPSSEKGRRREKKKFVTGGLIDDTDKRKSTPPKKGDQWQKGYVRDVWGKKVNATDRTVVNPAKRVCLAWTVARIVRSARDSLVSWSSHGVSE